MKEKIYGIIAEQLGMDVNEITEDASFVDNLGADSLDLVEMIMAFEEEFNVEISDDAADKIKTVGDALEYVKELM
ncbi:MAG: acyl carrier protein [Clostridia bacterium]|nr:acyl carrier protein [Clostridia bacterium]